MENQQQQQQPKQQQTEQPSEQPSDENEEMWNLFEENSFFFTDDESIDEDKEDIDMSIDEDKKDIDESIAKGNEDIDVSIAKDKEDIDVSIDEDKDDIDVSIDEDKEDFEEIIVEDKEDIDVSIDEDKKDFDEIIVEDIDVSVDENKKDIDEDIVDDKEDIDVSIVENKKDSDMTINEHKEDIEVSIDEDKEDIDVSIDEDKKDIDESMAKGNEDIDVSIAKDKEDIDVSIDEDKEDFDEIIVEDKEDIDVSVDENKKDIDMTIDEHKEDIEVSIDEDKEDIWNLFEELFPDDSKSEEISDATGKSIESENSTKSKNNYASSINSSLYSDKTPQDFSNVDIEIQKNLNVSNDESPESCNKRTQEKTGSTALAASQAGKISTTDIQQASTTIPTEKQTTPSVKRPHVNNGSESTTAAKQIKLEIPHEKNPITLLHEIFKGGPLTFYIKEIGDVNVPDYECYVEFKGQKYKGKGKSKYVARLNATDVAVRALMQGGYGQEEILSKDEIVLKKNMKKLLLSKDEIVLKKNLKKLLLIKEHIKKENGGYFCNLCSISSFGAESLFEHINGEKHKVIAKKKIKFDFQKELKPKIIEAKNEKDLKTKNLLLDKGHIKEEFGMYFCNLCSVYLKTGKNLFEHVDSKKHKVNTNNDLLCGKSINEKESDLITKFLLLNKECIKEEEGKYFCNLCSTSFGYESFLKHVNGKKHELNSKQSLTDEELILKSAIDKGHIKEGSLGKFYCNLCSENRYLLGKRSYKRISTTLFSLKGLYEHVKQENHVLMIELSKGHIKEENLDKYFCNLCSTTLFFTKSLLEHVEGKKHKNNLQLSPKGILNQSHENYYYKEIEEVLLSSENSEENSYLSSMIDINLKCKNNVSDENKSNKLHIIEEKLSSCKDPIVLEALSLGHLKLDTFGEFTCALCDVSSTKLTTVKIHLKGKKHKLKAKEFKEDQENGSSSSPTVLKDIPKGYFINMSGLSHTATQHDIVEFFSPVDIVSIRFIVASTEEDLSSHLGEADVEFLSQDDATIAMAKHLSIIDGSIIHLTLISTSVSSKRLQNPLVSNNPASLRLVVTDSQDVNMSIGTVMVLTSDHATIILESRDYKKLKDINVNYNESMFYVHDTEEFMHQYFVRDLGSKGGTLLNGTLICPQGSLSEFIPVNHGDIIQCGLVTLVCHIHPSSSFCFDCEKETKIPTGTSSKLKSLSKKVKERISHVGRDNQKDVLETSRRNELKSIRKKHGLTFMYNMDQVHVPNNPDYKDRANKRRKHVGSDNPYEKTEVAHTSLAISNKNKGFKMLASMGWKEGDGLGKDNSGILEPIRGDEVKDNRTGLGSTQVGGPPLSFKQKEKLIERQKILDITKERFYR